MYNTRTSKTTTPKGIKVEIYLQNLISMQLGRIQKKSLIRTQESGCIKKFRKSEHILEIMVVLWEIQPYSSKSGSNDSDRGDVVNDFMQECGDRSVTAPVISPIWLLACSATWLLLPI